MRMVRKAALLRGWTWLVPVCLLACVSFGFAWWRVDSATTRFALVVSVSAPAAAAILLGFRLARERARRSDRVLALAGIVETTGDAVVAARLDRTVTAWNLGAERLFGYSAEEMIGSSISRIAPAGLQQSLQEHLQLMLEKDGMHTYEVKRAHKSGRLIDVEITLSPLRDDDGRVVGISSIIRDISERRRLEAQREELLAREHDARVDAEYAHSLVEEQNERLLELDRMKDDFVASVSHELRTPLTSIHGYLDLLLDGEGNLTDEQQRFVEVVQRNSDRLMSVVGDLLSVAQVEAGRIALERERVDLARLLSDAMEIARPAAAAKRIDLALECDALELSEADPARLGQVFDNLICNAIKFTPAGGRVTVRAFAERSDAVIDVVDTGIGISPEDQARLFERFFRSASASADAIQGTGLGLAITKAIVESHDGSISVQSEPGRGTTFRVVLPGCLEVRTPVPAIAAAL
jgi:PAS domain S-box-containing protein